MKRNRLTRNRRCNVGRPRLESSRRSGELLLRPSHNAFDTKNGGVRRMALSRPRGKERTGDVSPNSGAGSAICVPRGRLPGSMTLRLVSPLRPGVSFLIRDPRRIEHRGWWPAVFCAANRTLGPAVPPIGASRLSLTHWVNVGREWAPFSDIPHRGFLLREDWDRPTGWEEAPGQTGSSPWGPQESALSYVGVYWGWPPCQNP
jgi:hypothetical protein